MNDNFRLTFVFLWLIIKYVRLKLLSLARKEKYKMYRPRSSDPLSTIIPIKQQ